MNLNQTQHDLFQLAKKASDKAYSPYSGFKVGAALLTSDDKVFIGCNVENASYSATICAERVAITKAVSEGYTSFKAIAVFVQSDLTFPPCGICRQFLSEFGSEIEIIYGNDNGVTVTNIRELLPQSFQL